MIVPTMFYNPQMGVFHSVITAKVYIHPHTEKVIDKPLITAKRLGQSHGWLSNNAEYFTHKSYEQAFDQVIQQLQSDTTFLQTIEKSPA